MQRALKPSPSVSKKYTSASSLARKLYSVCRQLQGSRQTAERQGVHLQGLAPRRRGQLALPPVGRSSEALLLGFQSLPCERLTQFAGAGPPLQTACHGPCGFACPEPLQNWRRRPAPRQSPETRSAVMRGMPCRRNGGSSTQAAHIPKVGSKHAVIQEAMAGSSSGFLPKAGAKQLHLLVYSISHLFVAIPLIKQMNSMA